MSSFPLYSQPAAEGVSDGRPGRVPHSGNGLDYDLTFIRTVATKLLPKRCSDVSRSAPVQYDVFENMQPTMKEMFGPRYDNDW